MKVKLTSITAAIVLCGFISQAQNNKPFINGDRVTFVGNSITEAGSYLSNIWLYYMTRFPDQKIEIINKGIGGNVSSQMNKRFERDVMSVKPTVVVLTFGMNDSKYFEYLDKIPDQNVVSAIVKESKDGYDQLESKFQKLPNVRKILMSSSPYDETLKKDEPGEKVLFGKTETMRQIANFQKQSAVQNNWIYVDLLEPMLKIQQKEQEKDPKFTLTSNDRVHPEEEGHFAMSYLFLKSQGLEKFPVADVEINHKTQKVIKQENCFITDLRSTTKGLYFSYLAKSLPFPVDTNQNKWPNATKQSRALKVIPFNEELNREILKITALEKGEYSLFIDDVKIGQFSAEEMAKGINMAEIPSTPQYHQAYSLLSLNKLRKEYEDKLREYYWLQFSCLDDKGLAFDDSEQTFDLLTKLSKTDWAVSSKIESYNYTRFPEIRKLWEDDMEALVDKIYQINKPQVHSVKVQPINQK